MLTFKRLINMALSQFTREGMKIIWQKKFHFCQFNLREGKAEGQMLGPVICRCRIQMERSRNSFQIDHCISSQVIFSLIKDLKKNVLQNNLFLFYNLYLIKFDCKHVI